MNERTDLKPAGLFETIGTRAVLWLEKHIESLTPTPNRLKERGRNRFRLTLAALGSASLLFAASQYPDIGNILEVEQNVSRISDIIPTKTNRTEIYINDPNWIKNPSLAEKLKNIDKERSLVLLPETSIRSVGNILFSQQSDQFAIVINSEVFKEWIGKKGLVDRQIGFIFTKSSSDVNYISGTDKTFRIPVDTFIKINQAKTSHEEILQGASYDISAFVKDAIKRNKKPKPSNFITFSTRASYFNPDPFSQREIAADILGSKKGRKKPYIEIIAVNPAWLPDVLRK